MWEFMITLKPLLQSNARVSYYLGEHTSLNKTSLYFYWYFSVFSEHISKYSTKSSPESNNNIFKSLYTSFIWEYRLFTIFLKIYKQFSVATNFSSFILSFFFLLWCKCKCIRVIPSMSIVCMSLKTITISKLYIKKSFCKKICRHRTAMQKWFEMPTNVTTAS